MAEDDHVVRSGPRFFVREPAAQNRTDPEYAKQLRCRQEPDDLFRTAVPDDIQRGKLNEHE